ncbi:hypothetical protein KUTeg_006185 [Tegillarca granosa]|uniref:Uncharacterized protein n=1 Tax=Tegillarca granosa TaxID=220873 RepID=A0ABQ9FHN4_TEGGR|nr:hypothetical protein KUTeg_006185 [Tegillarca granosa]
MVSKFCNRWARFIAEKNPALGFVLRKAVKFYRDTNIPASLVFYIMAADAGIEVGSFNTAWLCEDNKLFEKDVTDVLSSKSKIL